MITPQHYVVRGLYLIHPDVLDEACIQGRYVAEHFANTIIFVTTVWLVASYMMYGQGDVVQGAVMMVWSGLIAVLYMYVVLQHLPTSPWTPSPDPGMPYETDDLAENCGVFSLTKVICLALYAAATVGG